MSEQSQGPGWWLASDGRWYPPEQAPGAAEQPQSPETGSGPEVPGFRRTATGWEPIETQPARDWQSVPSEQPPGYSWASAPPPAPTSQGMSTGAKVAIAAVCGVVLLFVVLIAAVTLLGSNAESRFEEVGGRIDFGTTTVPAPPFIAPEGYIAFNDPEGEFSMHLAPGWVGAQLRGDREGLGRRVVPNDPAIAEAIDTAVASFPSEIVLFALDIGDVGGDLYTSNLNVLSTPRLGVSLDELEATIPDELASVGGTNVVITSTQLSTGEGLRTSFSFEPDGELGGVAGLQYIAVTEDTVWVLSFASDNIAGLAERFDVMARSFVQL